MKYTRHVQFCVDAVVKYLSRNASENLRKSLSCIDPRSCPFIIIFFSFDLVVRDYTFRAMLVHHARRKLFQHIFDDESHQIVIELLCRPDFTKIKT